MLELGSIGDLSDFFIQLIVAIIGSFVGLFLALYADSRIEKHHLRHAIQGLVQELEYDVLQAEGIIENLSGNGLVTTTLTSSYWNTIVNSGKLPDLIGYIVVNGKVIRRPNNYFGNKGAEEGRPPVARILSTIYLYVEEFNAQMRLYDDNRYVMKVESEEILQHMKELLVLIQDGLKYFKSA